MPAQLVLDCLSFGGPAGRIATPAVASTRRGCSGTAGGLVGPNRAGMHEKARKLFAHIKARILSDGILS